MTTISQPFLKCCRCHRLVFEGLQRLLGPSRLYHGLYTICEFHCRTCGEDGPSLRRTGRTVKDVLRTVLLDQSVRTGKKWHSHQSLQRIIEEDWENLFGSTLQLDDNWTTHCAAVALTSRDTFQRKGHAIRLVNIELHYPEYTGVGLVDNPHVPEPVPTPVPSRPAKRTLDVPRTASHNDWAVKRSRPDGPDRKPMTVRLSRLGSHEDPPLSAPTAVQRPLCPPVAVKEENALQSPSTPTTDPGMLVDDASNASEEIVPRRSGRRRTCSTPSFEAETIPNVEMSALEFDEEEDRPRHRPALPKPLPEAPPVPIQQTSIPTLHLPSPDFTPTADQIAAELEQMRRATQTQSTLQLLKHFQSLARFDLSFSLLHKTDVGRVVWQLRDYPDSRVQQCSEWLVARWKKVVRSYSLNVWRAHARGGDL
eukprot:GGOE01040591.1.p1 GENE.GGOE01040591.1~~GGOE01040591.1.p1  ORF type:complete len:430 (+),score=79.50 GGOE01040591.1:24-1292(+)